MKKSEKQYQDISIHCIGDISLDHHIVYANDIQVSSRFSPIESVNVYDQVGGAGFTSLLIKKLNPTWGKYHILSNEISINNDTPSSFSIVKQISAKWRIEKFIGMETRTIDSQLYPSPTGEAKGVIIHDFHTYYGNESTDISSYLNTHKGLRVILLRLANFKADSIYKKVFLQTEFTDIAKLIMFVSVDDIRSNSIQISEGLSWEKTLSDLYNAFQSTTQFGTPKANNDIFELNKSGYVIVVIDRFGFLLIDNCKVGTPIFRAIFCPKDIEVHNSINKEGEIFGLTTCTMLHVLKAIIENDFNINPKTICRGLKNGLYSMSNIYENGFNIDLQNEKVDMIFPYTSWQISNKQRGHVKQQNIIEIKIDDSIRNGSHWSILNSLYRKENDFRELIINVVKFGWENDFITKIPFVSFGKFVTTDREEIEQYREVRIMMEEHFQKSIRTRPLSIVVLGQPGSGKTFGITEVANSIESINKDDINVLEFNLTQFTTIDDLHNSFSLIRDSYLKGNHVLVFWDEFDANFEGAEFGWIKYFLSPMQGGKYYYGTNHHLLGSPIFIFACSKFSTWDRLIKFDPEIEQQNKKKNPIIRPAKFDDFISRIHGHLEVKGINPQNREDFERNKSIYLRRAILLHSILKKHCPSIFHSSNNKGLSGTNSLVADIDPELISKFIFQIKEFKYGIRSLDAIIQMSQLTGKRSFTLSCLPSLDQIRSHIGEHDHMLFSY